MMNKLKDAQIGETIWDSGEKASVKGLHVRVSSEGKMFYLYYRTRSKTQRRPKLGELGAITVAEARRRARLLLDRVALGEDPKGEWDQRKTEPCVSELWEKMWDPVGGHYNKERYKNSGWGREVKNIYRRAIEDRFGKLKVSEVNFLMVKEWHETMSETPFSANRALQVLSKMFAFAEEKQWRAQHSNPCYLVKKFPERKRARYATEDEIRRVIPILEREAPNSPRGVAFLMLLIFTGSRPRAIERATWEDLEEFEANGERYGILTFHGKSSATTGEDEKVLLPPQAIRALSRLPRIEGYTITGIKMPRRLWTKVKEEVGCEDLWARDWRRTFATVGMSQAGLGKDVIGALLNHHSPATTDRYAKLVDTSRMEAVTSIANQIDTIVKDKRA